MRTLIVDDEPLIRWSLGKALAGRGCVISEAGDARAALDIAAQGGLDLILLDLKLPDSAELSLLEQLRALVPTARIVVMTAFGTAATKARALELGAAAVVDKPFVVKTVVSIALSGLKKSP